MRLRNENVQLMAALQNVSNQSSPTLPNSSAEVIAAKSQPRARSVSPRPTSPRPASPRAVPTRTAAPRAPSLRVPQAAPLPSSSLLAPNDARPDTAHLFRGRAHSVWQG